MKKIFRYMFAVVAGIAALTACTNEPEEEGVTPDVPSTSEYVIVKVGMHEVNRSFTDAEGIKWNVGDQIKYAGGVVLTSEALTAEDIEDEGYTANFKFPAALNEVNRTGWFSSTKNHPSNNDQVEFTLGTGNGNIYSQAAAGEMNARYLFLHSGTGLINITKDVAPEVKMDIAGSIFRIMPYTELYNDEEIKSVELTGKNANGIVGTVAYDRGAGSYRGVNDINWQKSNLVRISLEEPFALTNANSRETSKGIYMALARTTEAAPIEGYIYTVKTNKATYTFSSDENLVIGENEVKNVYLKLENGTRVDDTARKGDLQYLGDLNAALSLLSYEGVTDKDGGYWYAQTKDSGSDDWVGRDGADNTAYYDSVVFECIDNATGEVADWLSVVYGGNGGTHWMITATPNEATAERSATVTATFPEFVNGYYIVENCKTKTVTITQQGYSLQKTLGFYGGIGDKTISGAGVDKQSLGYCVITVNDVYAEDWDNDSHNEQELYGGVVIECRDGGAAAPIVDWLTVEYGKNAEGKFNSIHLVATASANNTGTTRQALVCCTYNAPEGYKFEGGAKSYFRQFLVTQPSDSGVKDVEFWGGLADNYNHDANAQQDWGLSYWVINVDGATATDWGGDSHNEQLLYGSAEFKCYDYTNGVRGEEIDWVTVEYKRNAEGKVIDTWWLADIEANTGAARAAEIVCTWPELEGYSYKNGQNVKSTIIRQAGTTTGDDEGGYVEPDPDAPITEGYTYTVVKNNGNGVGAIFGMPIGGANGADFRIENIKLNGEAVTLTQTMANEVIATVFKNVDERPAAAEYDGYSFATNHIYMNLVSMNGSTMEVGIATTPDSQGHITRLTWYNSKGEEGGYWYVFVP